MSVVVHLSCMHNYVNYFGFDKRIHYDKYKREIQYER
uniref:Uncharacterized protein n=1 Tax=Anguilla anguilla TaxID=7936 RepID=A0A0E9T612_ANGAN